MVLFDGGTSLTKILYRVFRNGLPENLKHLVAQPEVIRLKDTTFIQSIGELSSQISGWVQLPPKKENKYYAVGKIAKDLGATSSIRTLKHEAFVPKILAAVAAIAHMENIAADTFTLNLWCLLPYSEYSNREELEKSLSRALKGYWIKDYRIKADLRLYNCYPEGVGLALELRRRLGIEEWKKQKKVALLIFGYRNTTCLFFENGIFSQLLSTSSDYGFYHLLDFAAHKLPGISREKIQEAIVTVTSQYLDVQQQKKRSTLLTKVDSSWLLKEIPLDQQASKKKKIEAALNAAKFHYWELIVKFLKEIDCSEVNAMYYGGGSGIFIKDKLSQYCQERDLPLLSSSELNSLKSSAHSLIPLREILKLKSYEEESFIAQNLELRFADVWNLCINATNYEPEYFQERSA